MRSILKMTGLVPSLHQAIIIMIPEYSEKNSKKRKNLPDLQRCCKGRFSKMGPEQKNNHFPKTKSSPAYMTKNPLSASQVKALAAYCKERKMTLFEFLMNKMNFKPYIKYSDNFSYCPFCYDLTRPGTIKPEGEGINKNKIYLATGAQSYKRSEGTVPFAGTSVGGYMQAIKMTEVGASNSQIKFFSNDTPYHITMMFFTKY